MEDIDYRAFDANVRFWLDGGGLGGIGKELANRMIALRCAARAGGAAGVGAATADVVDFLRRSTVRGAVERYMPGGGSIEDYVRRAAGGTAWVYIEFAA